MMKSCPVLTQFLFAVLLCSLADVVICQSPLPYITARGNLSNHSYVGFSLVSMMPLSIQCHTNKAQCCSAESSPAASWYDPHGDRISDNRELTDTYIEYAFQRIDLKRDLENDTVPVSGIYRCEIAIDDGSGNTQATGTAYVGLYIHTSGGKDMHGIGVIMVMNPHSHDYCIALLVDCM